MNPPPQQWMTVPASPARPDAVQKNIPPANHAGSGNTEK
jgi:hypothetical protein